MNRRWLVVCVLSTGCFSEPPTGDGGSTGEASTSSTSAASAAESTSSSTGDADASSSSTGFGTSTGSTSTGFGSTSTGEMPACTGDEMCIMTPPPSWNGPVVGRLVLPGNPEPDCPLGMEELWRAGRDPAAACDCAECSSDGVQCDAVLEFGANGFCEGTTMDTGCQPVDSTDEGQLWVAFDISLTPGSVCTPPTPAMPRFGQHAVVCDPMGDACDDGGTCIAGPVCIWQEGEQACPPPFAAQTILYDGFESKGLACDTCQCGAEAALCEAATISFYAEAACGGEPTATPAEYGSGQPCAAYVDVGGFPLIDDVVSVDIQPAPFDCSSEVTTADASGTFELLGARTLCCTP